MDLETESIYLSEPRIVCGFNQPVQDPRDGLMLFGPLDEGRAYGIRVGAIGTKTGLELLRCWLKAIQGVLYDEGDIQARPPFLGFETLFRIPWNSDPTFELSIPDATLHNSVNLDDRFQRVFNTVTLFSDALIEHHRTEDVPVDLWFVIVPDVVYRQCRPKMGVDRKDVVKVETRLSPGYARRTTVEPSLFSEDNELAQAYQYDVDFHNQLKARLLKHRILTQVVQESTLASVAPEALRKSIGPDKSAFKAAIAWNISAAAFYKAGGRPWKLGEIRPRVCYVGLAFKQDTTNDDPRIACCAAQMFLDSGDGVVFRGALGPWYQPDLKEYHLSRKASEEMILSVVRAYKERTGYEPRELFLHGKTYFSDEEWLGFQSAVNSKATVICGIRIKDRTGLRLFRSGSHPILRGTCIVRSNRSAYLFTRGFSPRLQTYPGREVPVPLRVDVTRGNVNIETVAHDILKLTKLNYNSCVLSDGLPVTLRFADAIGEILTAGPVAGMKPLQFKHYI